MGIKEMQGTSAYLEYVGPRGRKSNCKHYKNRICYNSKNQTYMDKCVGRMYCEAYEEILSNDEAQVNNITKLRSKQNKNQYENQYYNKQYFINKKVILVDLVENEILEIVLVEDKDRDEINNRISIDSPLGKLLIKSKKGEIIEFNQGSTNVKYLINNIASEKSF